jgi:flagellar biosynthetic protein FliO
MNESTAVELDSGLALLGQVTLVLILIIGIILLCAWLFRKLNGTSLGHSKLLSVVGSVSVGQRERVVIVELKDTWLVLGVASGNITKLHEMPAQERPEPQLNSFATRLQQALNKNTSDTSKETN